MLFEHYWQSLGFRMSTGKSVSVKDWSAACDYIVGMTDKYALFKFDEIFVPKSWTLLIN